MKIGGIFLGLFSASLIFIMVFPISPLILDFLLSLSLFLSIIALLITLYVENPLEMTSFPSLLLFLTAFRLSLSIASTRLILSTGTSGKIIGCFGEFVTQGNLLIGFILFSLLTLVNFLVITKGTGRIAEVAARFTLEALPGKQMALDHDLNARAISAEEAKQERKRIQKEADFFGAMDGASKFVKGDAIASIVILLVNLVGGFAVGVVWQGKEMMECLNVYTKLTVGDSLVHQIPALLVSLGAGILITRPMGESLSQALPQQLFRNSKVSFLGASLIALLALLPGMPHLLMLLFAILATSLALIFRKKKEESKDLPERGASSSIAPLLSLSLGIKFLPFAKEIIAKMTIMRLSLEKEFGITVPSLHVVDDLALPADHFALHIRGKRVCASGAESLFQVEERLKNLLEDHLHLFVTREMITLKLGSIKSYDNTLVEEISQHKGIIGLLSKVVARLLKEKVPIVDFGCIVEVVADHLALFDEKDPDLIAEKVRKKLTFHVVERLKKGEHEYGAITFDPKVEEYIALGLKKETGEFHPKTAGKIREALSVFLQRSENQKTIPIILASEKARLQLKRLIEREHPELPVLSFSEIENASMKICPIGSISDNVLL